MIKALNCFCFFFLIFCFLIQKLNRTADIKRLWEVHDVIQIKLEGELGAQEIAGDYVLFIIIINNNIIITTTTITTTTIIIPLFLEI